MPKKLKEKSGSGLPEIFCKKCVLENVLILDIHSKKPFNKIAVLKSVIY